MSYSCPESGTPGCRRPIETLRGWKRHMTHAHGGYSPEQLAAVTGTADSSTVEERMRELAATMPETEEELVGAAAGKGAPTAGGVPPSTSPAPSVPAEKRIRATPKKLRKLIATLPEKWFHEHEIELDEEDKEAIEEASEFLQDVFGFEFAVPAEKYVIRSRLWAFLWPAGVFLFIFLKHKSKSLLAEVGGHEEEKGSDVSYRQAEEVHGNAEEEDR